MWVTHRIQVQSTTSFFSTIGKLWIKLTLPPANKNCMKECYVDTDLRKASNKGFPQNSPPLSAKVTRHWKKFYIKS